MQAVKSLGIIIFFVLVALACTDSTDVSDSARSGKLRQFKDNSRQPVSHTPWLRRVLPDKTVVYLRLPSLWGALGQAKGNAFDTVYNNAAYAAAVQSIKQAFNEKVVKHTDSELRIIWKLFFQHATSPVEFMVAESITTRQKNPVAMITAKTDFASLDALNQFFSAHKSTNNFSPIQLIEIAQARQPGRLSLAGQEIAYYFAAGEQRLIFYISPDKPAPEAILTAINNLKPRQDHPMYKMERDLDASGQGLFVWASPQYARDIITSAGLQHDAGLAAIAGMGELVNGVAAGIGVSDGKQHITIMLDMPHTLFRAYLPLAKHKITLQSAGQLESVLVLTLPDNQYLRKMDIVLGRKVQIYQALQSLEEASGFSVEQLLDAVGPELIYLSDEAGGYAALRLRDKSKLEANLNRIADYDFIDYETRTIQDRQYYHLKIDYLPDTQLDKLSRHSDAAERIFTRLAATPIHLYWSYDGDYMILASVPQILMDRHYLKKNNNINQWLQQQLKVSADSSLLLAATKSRGAKRWAYHQELALLNIFADMVDAKMDIFSLPSSLEAGITQQGSFGVNLISSSDRLALEFIFDHSPIEMLSQNSMQTIAIAGILAAIAVPAYQRYIERARINAHLANFDIALRYVKSQAASLAAGANTRKSCTNIIDELNAGGKNVPGNATVAAFTQDTPLPGQVQIRGLDANGCLKAKATITIVSGPPIDDINEQKYPRGQIPDPVSIRLK